MNVAINNELDTKQITEDGTRENPFLINNADEFDTIRDNPGAFYKLMSDIEYNGITIMPTGAANAPFTGGLDGNRHTIKNFKVTGTQANTGLFGYAKGARIEKLTIEGAEVISTFSYTGALAGNLENCIIEEICVQDSNVTGAAGTGGLCGTAGGGSINRCCVRGNACITGTERIGGLAGDAANNVNDCYAACSVLSRNNNSYTGGLLGRAAGAVNRCYAACRVSANGSGLINRYPSSATTRVNSSYFDNLLLKIETDGTYNVGKLTAAMLRKETYKNWDFENTWGIEEGIGYPYLRSLGGPAGPAVDAGAVCAGAGTPEDPYVVRDAEGFGLMCYDLKGRYRLDADIDFGGEPRRPVGSQALPFMGGLDGRGHVLRGVRVEASGYDGAGLFGYARQARIEGLEIEGAQAVQSGNGGGAGVLAGHMEECAVEGVRLSGAEVSGMAGVGALAGYADGGSITRSSARGVSVSGRECVGGLLGKALSRMVYIRECCAEGSVSGEWNAGGLVGYGMAGAMDSYASGTVESTKGNAAASGLLNAAEGATVRNCYAACRVSAGGSGLVYLRSGKAQVVNSYFDSTLSGILLPENQARTTQQLLTKENYIIWDWNAIWKEKEGSLPLLKNIEAMEPFRLSARSITAVSAVLEWPDVPEASEYAVSFGNKTISPAVSGILIDGLAPDSDYDFRVHARIGAGGNAWSETLRIRTKKITVSGLHHAGKTKNSIAMQWEPVEDAAGYEVCCNGEIYSTDTNAYNITGLHEGVPNVIRIRALLQDGSIMESGTIIEKLYTPEPQTDYAREFVGKCEGQQWFLDEIENLLNLKGKSVNTITSRNDFAAIYAIGLADRGITGRIPPAIGELRQLKYLYLGNNRFSGELPKELDLLENLIVKDLSGNQFAG